MISIQQEDDLVVAAVLGQFTLDDYRQFEDHVRYSVKFKGVANLLFDFRDMLGYSVDVVWEELRFTRENAPNFGRIAMVSDNQWLNWLAGMQSLLVPTNLAIFSDYDEAKAWVTSSDDELV